MPDDGAFDLFAGAGTMMDAALNDVSERSAEVAACALCAERKTLRNSHIISNAVFRRIKQVQNSGQLIQLDNSEDGPVRRSQDTWPEYLLCADCEHIIGGYEGYGLELLRARNGSVEDHAGGVTFRAHDYRRFKLFLTSILWRAAVSRQDVFAKVILPERCKEEARTSLLTGKPLAPLRLGCRMRRLMDTKATSEYGFDLDSLSQVVITPIPRLHDRRNYYTFLFLIEGFLLEYFVRGVPFKAAGQRGIHRDSPVLFVPNKCIFDVPEIIDILAISAGKHERGLVTLKDRD